MSKNSSDALMHHKRIGIGVIGTGFGGTVHIPAFLRVAEAEMIGVSSRHPEWARKIAEKYALPLIFQTSQELLASPRIHAVSIATPPRAHRELVLGALRAGKAVFAEKPLGLNDKEAQEILDAARTAGRPHMVNFLFREHPVFRELHSMVAEGQLGDIRSVTIRWSAGSWADPKRPWSWQCNEAEGGGILGALVVHTMDYVEWLFGPIRRLTAKLSLAIPQRPDASGTLQHVTAADSCHLVMELARGTVITCDVTNVASHPSGHRLEVQGEDHTALLESQNIRDYGKGFRLWKGVGSTMEEKTPPYPAENEESDGRIPLMSSLAKRFVLAVQNGEKESEPSFRHGVRTQMLLSAIRESSEARHSVDIPPF
jgi:predicted dehydrogenase